MMKPLVSILIPAYNAAQWVGDSLRSAMVQTWPNKEIVVVDDGSSDMTLPIVQSLQSSIVRVVTQPNQGAAAARNRALSMSNGEYIQWLDADDLLAPNKVAAQMDALMGADARLLASGPWAAFLYRPHRAQFTPTPLWTDLPPLEWLLRKLEQNLHMQTATWLVPREVSEAAGPWHTALLGDDDGEYFCRVLIQSRGVKFVPEAKVYYRASGTSSLSYIARSNRKLEAQFQSMQLNIGYMRALEDSPRVRSACVTYLQNWLMSFYPERPDIVACAEELARQLGGHLDEPRFSWKYKWLAALGSPRLAKRAQTSARGLRWSAARACDRLFERVERALNVAPSP
jgi:glycosyltransferase involved in cell wall biosynthesis